HLCTPHLRERLNNARLCRWDVWHRLPPKAPLLPAERPDEAPPREVAAKPDDAKSNVKPDVKSGTKPDAKSGAKSDAEPDAEKSDAEKADEAEPPREEKPAK